MRIVSLAEAKQNGLKRYFTGKTCPNGHVAERYVVARSCVECLSSRKKEWGGKNKEKIAAYNKINNPLYYQRDKKKRYEKFLLWKVENPKLLQSRKQADYQKHKDKRRAKMKQWRTNNVELLRELSRQKREKNPEQYRAYKRNAKARRKLAPGSHSGEDISFIFRMQGGKCAYCRVKLPIKGFHVDHIHPIILGGSNYKSNLQVTCASCNLSKQARHPLVFARELGMLL